MAIQGDFQGLTGPSEDSQTFEESETVSPFEFLQALSKVGSFAQSNVKDENIHQVLFDLEKLGYIKKMSDENAQSKITKFFK